MAEEIKQYDGLERELVFVPRYAGPFKDSDIWGYCCARFRQRWAGEKKRRWVPIHNHEGKTGWWFPVLWIQEHATLDRRPRAA